MNKLAKRKGMTLSSLAAIGVVFVVVAIVVSFGSQILGQIRQSQCGGSWNSSSNLCLGGKTLQHNITIKGLDALAKIGEWLPTLALVVIAAIVIGIVVTYLGRTSEA